METNGTSEAPRNRVRPPLTVLLPTDAKLADAMKIGYMPRWQVYFAHLARHFDVTVHSCDTRNFSDALGVRHAPLSWVPRGIPYGPQIFYNLALVARARSMTRVVRAIGVPYLTLPLLARIFGKRIVLSHHYDYETTARTDFGGVKGRTARLRQDLSIRAAHVLLATTDELAQRIERRYGRIAHVVPNFVETDLFRPLSKEEIVLFAGRIVEIKGIETLLEAWSVIERDHGGWALELAGGGEIKRYADVVEQRGIDRVRFLGPVDNHRIPELMGRAAVFVLPTLTREGHPKALAEAMACGCACIATDVPGNREMIEPNRDGLLVPPGDAGRLRGAIERVIEDRDFARRLGEAACRKAERFDIRWTLEREIELIRAAVDERTPTPTGERA